MRYCGKVGFVSTRENPEEPGVWYNDTSERLYYGDVMRQMRRWESAPDSVNDNVNVNHTISIVADPFALDHWQYIRYAEFGRAKWKVTSIDVQYPRLILTLGGVWNG